MSGRGNYPRPIRAAIVPIGPSIAYIPLTRGQFSLVDSGDVPMLQQWNWCSRWSLTGFYAMRKDCATGRTVGMHRSVLRTSPGMVSDHINRNTLDNRRANLREATRTQNLMNRAAQRNNKSGYKGVSWDPLKKVSSKTVLETLTAARKMLTNKKRWTRRQYFRTASGKPQLEPTANTASTCAIGALCIAGGLEPFEAEMSAIGMVLASCMDEDVAEFNDTHTHAEVLAAFDAAIAKEKEAQHV